MKTKSILIALLVLMFTPVQAQINRFSLNSEDGNVVWKIFPQAETPMSGEKLSSGNTVKNAVTGIVPRNRIRLICPGWQGTVSRIWRQYI